MTEHNSSAYTPRSGYMTDQIRAAYIKKAVQEKLLPADAHRMEPVLSLHAPDDARKPILFWQLYSVMGPQRIVAIVNRFYQCVYSDEQWFTSVFARVGSQSHHVNTQSAMWIDVMGGGQQYHGGEFRLHFHHTHNAMQLMNDRGAQRWATLMRQTLDQPDIDYTDDPRVRPAINTFLTYFMSKYADEFKFADQPVFGDTNPPWKRRLNFLKMSSEEIEALPEQDLVDELVARRVDVSQYADKQALVNKALSL